MHPGSVCEQPAPFPLCSSLNGRRRVAVSFQAFAVQNLSEQHLSKFSHPPSLINLLICLICKSLYIWVFWHKWFIFNFITIYHYFNLCRSIVYLQMSSTFCQEDPGFVGVVGGHATSVGSCLCSTPFLSMLFNFIVRTLSNWDTFHQDKFVS